MAKKQILLYGSIFVVGAVAAVAITSLLVNIWERKHEASQYPFRVVEVAKDELDPAVWGKIFPTSMIHSCKPKKIMARRLTAAQRRTVSWRFSRQ